MQILASALPGFRDLRAPLIAGYLWLILLWIVVKPDVHKRPTNEVEAAVYDLAKDAGPLWIAIGVGVAAYLVGLVSQALSPILRWALSKLGEFLSWRPESSKLPSFLPSFLQMRLGRSPIITGYEGDPVQRYQREAMERPGGDDHYRAHALNQIETQAMLARRGLDLELELPATLLLTERGRERDEQLFSEADRLKAEGELRLTVAPPLCAVAIFLGLNQSCWWWFLLVPVAVLLWQGHSRNLAYRSLMFDALGRGLAHSQSLDKFKRWIESLPPPPPSSEQAKEMVAE